MVTLLSLCPEIRAAQFIRQNGFKRRKRTKMNEILKGGEKLPKFHLKMNIFHFIFHSKNFLDEKSLFFNLHNLI